MEEARGAYPSDICVEDSASSVPGVCGGVGGAATTDDKEPASTDGRELVTMTDGEEPVATMDSEELVISWDCEELIVTRDGEELIVTRDGEERIITRDGEEIPPGNADSSSAIIAGGIPAAVAWLSKARGLRWALGVAIGAVTARSGVDGRGV